MLNENDIIKLVEGMDNFDIKDFNMDPDKVDIRLPIDIKEDGVKSLPEEKKVVSPPIEKKPVGPTHLRRRRGRQPGHVLSQATKNKIRAAKIGKKMSEETKQKIKEAHAENKSPISLELLLSTDLSKCKQYLHNRYMNVYIPNPNFNERPFGWYLRLGRCIVEQKLGRRLLYMEDVHYIDRNPLNNDPGNLCVLLKKDHVRLHKILDKIVPISEWKADAENCIWEDFKAGAL